MDEDRDFILVVTLVILILIHLNMTINVKRPRSEIDSKPSKNEAKEISREENESDPNIYSFFETTDTNKYLEFLEELKKTDVEVSSISVDLEPHCTRYIIKYKENTESK